MGRDGQEEETREKQEGQMAGGSAGQNRKEASQAVGSRHLEQWGTEVSIWSLTATSGPLEYSLNLAGKVLGERTPGQGTES